MVTVYVIFLLYFPNLTIIYKQYYFYKKTILFFNFNKLLWLYYKVCMKSLFAFPPKNLTWTEL